MSLDGDPGRHIRVGETILHSGLFYRDPFSFTKAGAPFVPYEWLSEVLTGLSARAGGLDADLAMVGHGRLDRALSGPGLHLLGHVTDLELDGLYAGALALVMPSRLEGFGLPPLEAALRGIPSIVTDLPEFAATMSNFP